MNKVEFMKSNSDEIEYGLYPDQNDNYTSYSDMNIKEDNLQEIKHESVFPAKEIRFSNEKDFLRETENEKNYTFKYSLKVNWTDDLTLYIGHTNRYGIKMFGNGKGIKVDMGEGDEYVSIGANVVYIIAHEDEIISGFYDDQTTFQLGDCATITYIHDDNDLVVLNGGDVSSTVVLRYKG